MIFRILLPLFVLAACISWLLKMNLPDSLKRFAWWPLKILTITCVLIWLGLWLFLLKYMFVDFNGLGWIFSVPFIALWIFLAYRMIVDFLVDDI
jgi:hypothetical protein